MNRQTQPALPPSGSVLAAAHRLEGVVYRTPVVDAVALSGRTGCRLLCKCEHFQHTGAFKYRGASNAVALLGPDVRGVATHSSGNHGAALAAAATCRGLQAQVVLPRCATAVKRNAVQRFGGVVHDCASTQDARERCLAELGARGWECIHPYDDARIIAGQGTAALEFIEDHSGLDALVVPVGGGGLMAGTLLAVRALGREIPVYGAEPFGADDTWRSLQAGRRVTEHHPDTRADGLFGLVGILNFAVIRAFAAGVIRVTDEEMFAAMRLIRDELDQIVEPASATVLAAVLREPEPFRGRCVGLILSGGNVESGHTPP